MPAKNWRTTRLYVERVAYESDFSQKLFARRCTSLSDGAKLLVTPCINARNGSPSKSPVPQTVTLRISGFSCRFVIVANMGRDTRVSSPIG